MSDYFVEIDEFSTIYRRILCSCDFHCYSFKRHLSSFLLCYVLISKKYFNGAIANNYVTLQKVIFRKAWIFRLIWILSDKKFHSYRILRTIEASFSLSSNTTRHSNKHFHYIWKLSQFFPRGYHNQNSNLIVIIDLLCSL